MAYWVLGKKGKSFYSCVKSVNLEIPRMSHFVSSMSSQHGIIFKMSISNNIRRPITYFLSSEFKTKIEYEISEMQV